MHQAAVADPAGGEPGEQQHRDDHHDRVGDPGRDLLTPLELGHVPHQGDGAEADGERGHQHQRPGRSRQVARLGQRAEDRKGRQHAGLDLGEGDPGGGAHHDRAAQQHHQRPHRQQRQQRQLQQREHQAADDPGVELVEERGLGRHVREHQDQHQQHPGAEQAQQRQQRGAGDRAVGGGQQLEHAHARHRRGGLAPQRPQQADQSAADGDQRPGDDGGGHHRRGIRAAADRGEHGEADRVGPAEGGEGDARIPQRPDAQHAVAAHELEAVADPAQRQRGQEHEQDLQADGGERHRPVDHAGAQHDPAAVPEHQDVQRDQHGVQRGGARGGAGDLRRQRRHDHHGQGDPEHGQRREEPAHQGRRDAVAVCAHAMLLGRWGKAPGRCRARGLSPDHGRTSPPPQDASGDGTRVTARRRGGVA